MLFVVVLEFFICWTPLYVINTITLFNAQLVYQKLGYQTISFFQLLAYSSSCCNPITYCFMNRGFRKACLNLFRCCKRYDDKRRISIVGGVTQSSEVTQLHRIHREAVLQTTYTRSLVFLGCSKKKRFKFPSKKYNKKVLINMYNIITVVNIYVQRCFVYHSFHI